MERRYVNLRPAGMSDEDDDNEDDFDFSYEDEKYDSLKLEKQNLEIKEIKEITNYKPNEEYIVRSNVINACTTGDLTVIQEYLEQHDSNEFLHTGWTLLLYAVSSVQLEVTELLLANGANPNIHHDGFTPLMALCNSTKETTEKLKCLALLIEDKADVNMMSKHRETALMYACKSQDAEFIIELLKHVKDINVCDNNGRSALTYAVSSNKPDIVKILLEHNADISLTDKFDLIPKDIADTKGYKEISALLATDEEEILTNMCELSQITTWQDLFPNLYPKNEELLDYDISIILHGMCLENYGILFQGMDLTTFLQLTENDLHCLGIDITVHRKQFMENLQKFHCRKWHPRSIGKIDKFRPFTIYDGVISLGNVKKQIAVIASSFQFIKNNITNAASKNIHLSTVQKIGFEEELRKTQQKLKSLKTEIIYMRKLAKKIDKENDIGVPAALVTNVKKNKSGWIMKLGATLIIGFYLYKTTNIQRLWNVYTIRS